MIYTPPSKAPAVELTQGPSALEQALSDKKKLDVIRAKYNLPDSRTKAPQIQWKGDPNG